MKQRFEIVPVLFVIVFYMLLSTGYAEFGNMFGTPKIVPKTEGMYVDIPDPVIPKIRQEIKAPSYYEDIAVSIPPVKQPIQSTPEPKAIRIISHPMENVSAPKAVAENVAVSSKQTLSAEGTSITNVSSVIPPPTPDTAQASAPISSPSPLNSFLTSLTESYDSMLGLYEQTFSNGYSFLTNITNGGRTYDEVYLDYPANMSVYAEFEGTSFDYTSKQHLTQTGYYTFTIYCKNSEGAESKAIFSFRILPPHDVAIDSAEDSTAPEVQEFFPVNSNGGQTTIEYSFSNHRRFYANIADGETVTGPVYFVLTPGLSYDLSYNGKSLQIGNNEPLREPGGYVMRVVSPSVAREGYRFVSPFTVIAFTIEKPQTSSSYEDISNYPVGENSTDVTPYTSSAPLMPESNVVTPDSLTAAPDGDAFRMYFSNGLSFISSINNRSTTSESVYFEIPAGIDYEMFRDNEKISYLSGEILSAIGSYSLKLVAHASSEWESSCSATLTFNIAEAQKGDDDDTVSAFAPTLYENAVFPEQSYIDEVFRQQISIDMYFTSTVPNGMMSQTPVQFSIPEFLARRMTYDGTEIDILGDEVFSNVGAYELYVTNPATSVEYLFYFTILPTETNSLEFYAPPRGYEITSFMLDGLIIPHLAEGVIFDSDGNYSINLESSQADFPIYSLNIIFDTVAPQLNFIGAVDGKATEKEVFLECDDPTAVISVLLNGKELNYRGNPLTKNGKYTITVKDNAGNFNEYLLTIPYKMSRTTVLFIVLILILLSGGGYYFWKLRKNTSV